MIKITKANAQDIATIQDLANKSWTSAYRDILSQDQLTYMLGKMYATEELLSQLENPNYHYQLIYHNEQAIGFIGYEHFLNQALTKFHRIYLVEESKGKGAGKVAVDFVKAATISVGNKRLILTVNKNNTAKHFYELQGFSVYEEAVFDIGNGYVMDDYLMEYIF